MRLTFHIVVTPGSVKLAHCALASMLHWTPWRFVLVSNGLARTELLELHRVAAGLPRTAVHVIPEHTPLPHGIVLNRLFTDWREPYFAFVDVDFFITGPVANQVHDAVQTADVVTAGYHLALEADQARDGFEGKRLVGPRGETLGVTFFAVYRTGPLREVMQRWRIGFERYDAPEFLPDAVRRLLWQKGYRGWAYDTAKVLNMLLLLDGRRIVHLDRPELQHVGGLAGMLLPVIGRRARMLLKLKRRLADTSLTDRSLQPPLWQRLWWRWCQGPARYQDRLGTYRREQVARFFARYFRSLISDAEPPALLLAEGPLRSRIERMCATLAEAVRLAGLEPDADSEQARRAA